MCRGDYISKCISKIFFRYSVTSLSYGISLKYHDFPARSLDEIPQICLRYDMENNIYICINASSNLFFLYIVNRIILMFIGQI